MLKIIINRRLILIATILALVFGALLLLSSRSPKQNLPNSRIQIVTSFYPLAQIVKSIGGNFVEVKNLVPAGVEPHDFEPSSRDLVEIGNAEVLLYNGASLEPWIGKWTEGNSPRPKHISDMAKMLEMKGVVLMEKDGATDPHFWLDPVIMKSEVEVVLALLLQISPEQKELFTENAKRFSTTLDALDQQFRNGLASCSLKDVVVLHEAFNYLARQYAFRVTSIEGISPDEEPSPRELARIVNLVREKKVKHIFFETVSSPKFSELIAREIGGTTLVLNPIESLTPNEVQLGEDYVSLMQMNLNNLRIAMLCL